MTFSLLCWCCALVFRNGVCADRSGMVASRFLTAAAVCEIFLSSAAEIHKSYCSDCMKVANGALAADFSILALMMFLLRFLLKSA